jgi:LacI family transcriptional regulator
VNDDEAVHDGVAPGERATLASVAASAGVSVATVSRVLNGRGDVGEATRARVESLLREHEYRGRRPGAAVKETASTARIELVFSDPMNAHSLEVLRGVLDAGDEIGVSVVVALDRERPASWARGLAAAGRQGVITVVSELQKEEMRALERAHIPVVVIDPTHPPRAQVTSVGATNFAGGLAAARHLLSLGHRRIAYIGGHATATHNQARMHGYRAALETAGVHVPDGYIQPGRFLYADGAAAMEVLFALPEPPTAVFAGSDETAAGVLEAARVRGLRVPEDLSVVGFDDTQLARYSSPPLTTVRQPLHEMGAVALRTALRLAAGEKLDSHHVELATELIVRNSTAPLTPPAAG